MYRLFLKPLFFMFDAELVHNSITFLGNLLGNFESTKAITKWALYYESKALAQKVFGLNYNNPIGLSAGFDYNAQLTQIMPSVGFGFETVGTVTNGYYEGNPKPRLARLPKSKSLLVNKGFKSEGADEVISKLKKLNFEIPIGISIGRTNSANLQDLDDSIEDIVLAFEKFEKSKVKHSYYELNISCPNLINQSKKISFYDPESLEKLLKAIDKLKIRKPVLIKMPITETNNVFLNIIKVASRHKIAGVIIGNLQKDRENKVFDRQEVKEASAGNFSGKPCFARSNELISLAYKNFGKKLVIIGCGGIFTAQDVYEKIKRGASLVMMITGMIYEGPQVIGRINRNLAVLVAEDGYSNISEAVGDYYKNW